MLKHHFSSSLASMGNCPIHVNYDSPHGSQNQYGTSPDLCRQRVCRKRVRTAQTGIGAPLLVSNAARNYRKDQSILLKRLQSLATKAQSTSKKRERQTNSRQGPTVKFVDQKVTKKLSPKPCSDPTCILFKLHSTHKLLWFQSYRSKD